MRIIVTGSEGFVGKELISQCTELGIGVLGIDIKEKPSQKYEYIPVDIRSAKFGGYIRGKYDALVHLAAISRDTDCRGRAYECFDVNVMGTLGLIRTLSKKNIKQFIFASSEWVYNKTDENKVIDEETYIDITKLDSEYGLSKIVSESSLRQVFSQGYCPVTILRFGIMYGPRRNNLSAVESIFLGVAKKEKIVVGSLKSGRCYLHIKDAVGAIKNSIGIAGFNIVNVAGDRLITLGEIIETSKKILSKNPRVVEKDPNRVSVRRISNKKAKKLLKWRPRIDLKRGLETLREIV